MDNNNEKIPFVVFQSEMARSDKRFQGMLILVVILVAIIFGSNAAWMVYENQYVDTVTVSQDAANGNNNYIGGSGRVTNGTTDDN